MNCKHKYYATTLNGSYIPEFYTCNLCGNIVKYEDECWYYDKETNELKRDITY